MHPAFDWIVRSKTECIPNIPSCICILLCFAAALGIMYYFAQPDPCRRYPELPECENSRFRTTR